MAHTIWYTRCPVATASGIAYQRNMFEELFAGSGYEVRNLKELGKEKAATHLTHTLADSCREGGALPPLTARQSGADTTLVGFTYVAETLSFYVRADSDIQSFSDLAGKRLRVPVRDNVASDNLRHNAHKAFLHALEAYGMSENDVQLQFMPVDDDLLKIANVDYGKGAERKVPSIYAADVESLLNDDCDAIFAKSAEAKFVERRYAGQIRKIYDLLDSGNEEWLLNSNPRIITASGNLARDHREGLVRYLQVLIRAAAWADSHPAEVADVMAAELGVEASDIYESYEKGFEHNLWPTLSEKHLKLIGLQRQFMVDHGYVAEEVKIKAPWLNDSFLREAYDREGLAWPS